MNIEFLSLTVEGFKTFAKPQELALTSSVPGLTFIRGRNEVEPRLGSNGSGKSSLFDALTWCLYGRTVSNLRNPDLKPWSGKGDTMVRVWVSKDGRNHCIKRLAVTNGLLLDKDVASQDQIDTLIGIPFEVFIHTLLLGQGRPLFFDLAPKDKMALFSSTLQLDRWEDRAKYAGQIALGLSSNQTAKQGELTGAEAALKQFDDLMASAKARAAEWEKERKARVAASARERAELDAQLAKLQKARDEADLKYDGALTELKACEREADKLRDLAMQCTNTYNKSELLIDGLKQGRTKLQRELATLGKTDKCPTCGQSLKGTNLAKHKAELEAEIANMDKAIERGVPPAIANALASARGKLEDALKYAEGFKAKAEGAAATLDRLQPAVTALETKIQGLAALATAKQDEINPHHEELAALRRKRNATVAKLEALDKEIALLGRKALRTKFWASGFKDVRLFIIEEVLQELEMATNALLPESGLDGWEVHYAIEKETKSGTTQRGLNVSVLSPANKSPVRWESWSGGEGQRLRLVGALALSEVLLNHAGVSTNLEILDEPTRHLSGEGVQDLCEFLAERARQLDKNIFYVDHQAVESAHFAETITVVKTKAGSRIEK